MDIGLIINRDSLSQLPHERLVSTCLPVLPPASGDFIPPEMQVVNVRSTKRGGQSEPCRRFPTALFCFQSLRDNLAHQNKNANGQERGKEKFVWKNSGLENYFFSPALYQILSGFIHA